MRPRAINLLDMVCSYDQPEAWYDSIAARIASSLGWQAVEEHADRKVWPPDEATELEKGTEDRRTEGQNW